MLSGKTWYHTYTHVRCTTCIIFPLFSLLLLIFFFNLKTISNRGPNRKQKTWQGPRRSDPDNTYYAQLTTGQTMQNNILVCDENNSIITSKWEIRTQFALHSVNPLYVLHFHCIPHSRAHLYNRYMCLCMCVCMCIVWHSCFLRLYTFVI